MRLTLRTLLAYLDDVLPPEQAKELGKKLGESNYATALVDRIKDVLRRRRLSAPELFGKSAGIDPNVVADYLDNELSPNDVGDVEKICLDSDVHLAEVAACHQILTLVLGEPVDVRPETRARMYALGPVAVKDVLRADDASPTISMGTGPRIVANMEPVVTASTLSPIDRTLPDYLKPKSSWRQTALLALLLLVLGGWIGLLWNDGTLNLGRGNSSTLTSASQLNPAANAMAQKTDPKPIGNQAKAETSTSVAQAPLSARADDTQAQPTQVAENSVPDETATVRSQLNEAGPGRNLPAGRAITNAEAPLNAPIPRKPQAAENAAGADAASDSKDVPVQAAEPKTLTALRMLYSARDGRLLHWDSRLADFLVLPNRSELRPNDRLACPEPFRADIVVGDDIAQIALIGGTAATCLKPTDRAAIGFDIAQGVLLIEANRSEPTADPDEGKPSATKFTLPIAIVLRGRSHLLELTTDDALCAIEVRRHEPLRFQTPSDEPGYSAALHVANGTVKLTKPDGAVEQLIGPGLLPMTADWAAPPKPGEPTRVGPSISPDWLEGDPRRSVTRAKTPYKAAFEKEFDAEQPLLLTMPAIINNPRPALSELAVKCLALTDSYQPLVKALITLEQGNREARLAAIAGLRQWLSLDPKHEGLLKSELERHLPAGDTETVMRLMWGYSLADAKTPAASRQLVAWLEHDQVAIRELAFYHVQRLTGLKNEYSPVTPPSQRRVSVERWYTHLEKKGGALVAQ